jgi:dienelactone hydrolase
MTGRLLSAATAVFLLAACADFTAISGGADLQRTWSRAVVVLPPLDAPEPLVTRMGSREMAARLGQRPAGSKLPVVVYLHGCTGIGNLDLLRWVAEAGFAVVAPDSFARNWRPLQCDPETRTGGYNLFVYDLRLAEIAYAVDQLWQAPWADRGRMALLGSSEGAVAAALYRGDEFRGRVIAQWTCSGAPHVEGIAAPAEEPILALVGGEDPWYAANPGLDCGQFLEGRRLDCGQFLEGRPLSTAKVIEGAGLPDHEVLADPAVQELVAEFLLEVMTP